MINLILFSYRNKLCHEGKCRKVIKFNGTECNGKNEMCDLSWMLVIFMKEMCGCVY